MESMRGRVETRGCGERRKADGYSNAADGDDGGTGALQNGNYETGPIEPARVCSGHFRVRRSA